MQSPDKIYGDLFIAVQASSVFPDSKTFVDCVPKSDPEGIVSAYAAEKDQPGFDLRAFVNQHFYLPESYSSGFQGDASRPVAEHINLLWKVLRREADTPVSGSSRIPLPHPYIVPGGRFGEIYYWDSYFTMLGLLESGHSGIVKDMLANFAWLIDTVGHIPNGNRTYFLSRSQPPFFALMVNEAATQLNDPELYAQYTPQVLKEYLFWMQGAEDLSAAEPAARRVVRLDKSVILNRYWDDEEIPRQESYREDVELAEKSDRPSLELYRDLRAACESGWDFSARWCRDPQDLSTIYTTDILPVDLNCLIWSMENFLAIAYEAFDQKEMAASFERLRDRRKDQILTYFWDAESSTFRDYDWVRKVHTPVSSAAMMFPLFMQIAGKKHASGVAAGIQDFIKPGGLVSTLHTTGQQWDAPNAWAPLQWVAYAGLKNYGFNDLARTLAQNWIRNVLRVYQNTGKLQEKYNAEDLTLEAGGGEYPVQDGFGWTNGVLLRLLAEEADEA